MPPKPMDRDLLHQLLWNRTDTKGRLKVKQGDLAEEIGCRFETVSRIFKEFQEQGRIRKISAYRCNVVMYEVVDPDVWRWRTTCIT